MSQIDPDKTHLNYNLAPAREGGQKAFIERRQCQRQGLAKRRGICNEVVIHHHRMCRWGISRLLVRLAEGARRACEGILDSGIGKGSRKGSLFLFYIYPMMFCSGMCL